MNTMTHLMDFRKDLCDKYIMYPSTLQRPMRMSSRPFIFREHISDSCRTQPGKEKSLDSLHSQLQNETEKMVRWKVTTEIALDQKEKQLDESQKTIKRLRSNLVEQQLSSEYLSQSYLREKCHREQVDSKVETTRHLCSALKNQQEELKTSVKEFALVREHLSLLQEKREAEILSLKTSFDELTISHKHIVQELKTKAASEISNLRKTNSILDEELNCKRSLVETLQDNNKNQKDKIENDEKTISILENRLCAVASENENYLEKLNAVEKELNEVTSELAKRCEEFEEKLLSLRINLASEKDKVSKLQSEFEEAVGKIKYLKKVCDSLEGSKEELCQQLEMVNRKKVEIEQELCATKDKLDTLSCQAKQTEAILRGQISYLEEKTCDLNSSVETGKNEMENLITEQKATLSRLECELNLAKVAQSNLSVNLLEKEACIGRLNQDREEQEKQAKLLQEAFEKKLDVIKNLESFNTDVQSKFESACKETQDLKLQLEVSQKQLLQEINVVSELRKKIEILDKNIEMQNETLKTNTEQYNAEKKALQEDLEKLESKYSDITETCNNSNLVLKALLEKIKLLEDSLELSKAKNASMNLDSESFQEVTRKIELEKESFREELEGAKNQLELEKQISEQTKEELSRQISATSSLQLQLSTLEEELRNEQINRKKCEKEFKSKEKSLTAELKKSEKLKTRIENLEEKLKDKLAGSEILQDQLNAKVDSLTSEKIEMQGLLESSKNEAEQKEKELKKVVEEVKATAQEECEKAKMEAQSKIQEIVTLMESFKKDYDVSLKEKDDELREGKQKLSDLNDVLEQVQMAEVQHRQSYSEIESKKTLLEENNKMLGEELSRKKNEIEKLKNAVKVLTSPTKKGKISSPLKTPSPGQYLPYVRNQSNYSYQRSYWPLTNSPMVTVPCYEKIVNKTPPVCNIASASPRNTEQEVKSTTSKSRELLTKKSVTFTSPPAYSVNDSDSSDAFVLEVGSDVDERFDLIRRPTHTRQGLPQANVPPIPRASTTKSKNTPKMQSSKRARMDKSAMKTYSSPRERGVESEQKSPSAFLAPRARVKVKRSSVDQRVSFESVFNYPDNK